MSLSHVYLKVPFLLSLRLLNRFGSLLNESFNRCQSFPKLDVVVNDSVFVYRIDFAVLDPRALLIEPAYSR